MIRFENVSCGYGEQSLFDDLSFEAKKGDITAISAPSGVGKTTLLKAINRLHEIEDGNFWHRGDIIVTLDGVEQEIYAPAIDTHILRRKIAYIFQSPVVLPMSINANMAFGLKLVGERDKDIIENKIRAALEQTGLWDEVKNRLHHSAEELSLGQMQRLAIARALVLDPDVILFDEPTSSLDEVATLKIEALMSKLKTQRIILLVSHDKNQIVRVSDKEIVL